MIESTEINGEDYSVTFDANQTVIKFQGELALGTPKDYAPINNLLNAVVESKPPEMTIDLRELDFLNSSGISMLSKFVLGLRKQKDIQLVIIGSEAIPWQNKSLKNLQKFLPTLILRIE
jgi:hypothetical protein